MSNISDVGDREYFSIPLAARELGLSTTTLYRWAYSGIIESSRNPAGKLRISADVVKRIRDGDSMDEPDFYSIARAASELGIGIPTMYRWVGQGWVASERNSLGRMRISNQTLQELISMEGEYPWVVR